MTTYNIISKTPKGNIRGKMYTVFYQKDNKPQKYSVQLYCFGIIDGKAKYCFKADDSSIPQKDRELFLKELAAYQRGSSYRRSHPISKSNIDLLKEKRIDLETQINNINRDIKELETNEFHEKLVTYQKSIDQKSLEKFSLDLHKFFCKSISLSRYAIVNNFSSNKIYIFDKTIRMPVKVLTFYEDCIDMRDLLDSELKNYL